MEDQASRLRQIVKDKSEYDMKSMGADHHMQIITVTSGKGGVGKTSFSVNFAIALSRRGKRVLVLDADFGLANVDLMLGLKSKHDLTDILEGRNTIKEIIATGHEGIKFISGGSGISDLLNITSEELGKVMAGLSGLENEADILIIDTGAGVNEQVMQMVNASEETLLVITPEPTSIMDGFAMIKNILKQDKNHKVRIIVNRAESQMEADAIINNFSDVVEKFLGTRVTALGCILTDRAVSQAIRSQIPFIVGAPDSQVAIQVKTIADDFLNLPRQNEDTDNMNKGLLGFLKKLIKKK
ncbi:MAG: MinD/ParA family protein [Lachnospiraceae bacterium]|nr:MinD/ParA family protein [Lachnospiraceae bacterium]